MAFPELPKQPDFPALEEGILRFWEKERIFEKTLSQAKGKPPYVFYEGPPTANGKPHIGHTVTRIFKDIIPRYKTMRGYFVLRKGGWDTHGLPVEIEVEKSLGISGKNEIENIVPGDPIKSIARFNELCKRSVWKYVKLWEKMIRRAGNWIDLEHAYVTYTNEYIESVWWAFKEYWDKGLLYRGFKVVPYCTRCGTPLSSHEVAQGYEEIEDASVYVKLPLVGEKDTSLLAWTTTPWTLPGNIALAVDPAATYVKVRDKEEGKFAIVAEERLSALGLKDPLKSFKGSDLVGRRYQPLFPWLRALVSRDAPQFSVVPADFVSMKDGTGIVHTAVMYGEEDFALGQKLGLPQRHLVDRNGRFEASAGWLAGKYVKDADPLIVHDLKARNLVFREERIRHAYPFCWRCHKPLLYYALDSWFVKTTALKEELKKNNRATNWVPEYVGRGRMGNWYETLIDWSMSRNRYWGTPLPAWVCDKNSAHIEVIGSFEELAKRWGKRLPKDFDPHKPFIDAYTWSCSHKDGGVMRRTPEVTDVWHDAGSMPFAQWHYPFENKNMIEQGQQFPADYISEAIDQTRGWFFSLQASSTILFKATPYKNVVVFAHALDEKGRKMSKHLGNVVDPWDAFGQVGADPMRWFFLTSVTIGMPYRVSIEVLREVVRRFFLIFWNSLNFFTTYASLDGWKIGETGAASTTGELLDRWIVAKREELVERVTSAMDRYDFPGAGRLMQEFVVNDLSTWYIRRSRDRVGSASSDADDKKAFYATLYDTFRTLAILLAPFTPFLADYLYRLLRTASDPISVHLVSWPGKGRVDRQLIAQMDEARHVVEEGMRLRKEKGIKVRQPLRRAEVSGIGDWTDALKAIVAGELNVKVLETVKKKTFAVVLDTRVTLGLKEEGTIREVIRAVQDLRKKAGYRLNDRVRLSLTTSDRVMQKVLQKYQAMIEQATVTRVESVSEPDAEGTTEGVAIAVKK